MMEADINWIGLKHCDCNFVALDYFSLDKLTKEIALGLIK